MFSGYCVQKIEIETHPSKASCRVCGEGDKPTAIVIGGGIERVCTRVGENPQKHPTSLWVSRAGRVSHQRMWKCCPGGWKRQRSENSDTGICGKRHLLKEAIMLHRLYYMGRSSFQVIVLSCYYTWTVLVSHHIIDMVFLLIPAMLYIMASLILISFCC